MESDLRCSVKWFFFSSNYELTAPDKDLLCPQVDVFIFLNEGESSVDRQGFKYGCLFQVQEKVLA